MNLHSKRSTQERNCLIVLSFLIVMICAKTFPLGKSRILIFVLHQHGGSWWSRPCRLAWLELLGDERWDEIAPDVPLLTTHERRYILVSDQQLPNANPAVIVCCSAVLVHRHVTPSLSTVLRMFIPSLDRQRPPRPRAEPPPGGPARPSCQATGFEG